MDFHEYLPASAEDYIRCVRELAALIDMAMDEAEKSEFVSEENKSKSFRRLAEGVETIACLRGDAGIFYAARPHNLNEYQAEMYHIEDTLKAKLKSLGYKYPQQH